MQIPKLQGRFDWGEFQHIPQSFAVYIKLAITKDQFMHQATHPRRFHGSSATIAVAIAMMATLAEAGTQILCKPTRTGQQVVLELNARKAFGHQLNCIDGDFIADMTPCAPTGAFGLSMPTGSTPLTHVVDRWQDYAQHLGGVAGSIVTKHEIRFMGGFNSPSTKSGFVRDWEFVANRLTGEGTLTQGKNTPLSYKCVKADKKF